MRWLSGMKSVVTDLIQTWGSIVSLTLVAHSTQGYLETKRDRMDHMLEEEPLEGQYCLWDHDSMDIWRTRDSSGPRPGPGPGPGPEHQS